MTAAWVVLFVAVLAAGAAAEALCQHRRRRSPPATMTRRVYPLAEADFEAVDVGIQQRNDLAEDVEAFLARTFGWPA